MTSKKGVMAMGLIGFKRALLLGALIAVAAIVVFFLYKRETGEPTSQAAFMKAYRAAYNAGNRDAVLALAKWDDVPNELRAMEEWMLTIWIGAHKVTSIQMVPYVPDPAIPQTLYGRPMEANLEPRFWLMVENEGHEGHKGGKSSGKTKVAVGIGEDGVYRFCGMRWAGNPEQPVVPHGFKMSLLDVLVCPENHSSLALATQREIDSVRARSRAGLLRFRSGKKATEAFDGLLIRADGRIAYMIRNGAPVMVIEKALVLDESVDKPNTAERTKKR